MKRISRDEILSRIQTFFDSCPEIRAHHLHGSLSTGNNDRYSDIDIKIDVSGYDNGEFMLRLPGLLSEHFEINYIAHAPLFIPDLYLVTIHFADTDVFHFIDIECLARPHVQTVQKDHPAFSPHKGNVRFKLLVNCLKSYLRGNTDTSLIDKISGSLNIREQSDRDTLYACFYHYKKTGPENIGETATAALQYL